MVLSWVFFHNLRPKHDRELAKTFFFTPKKKSFFAKSHAKFQNCKALNTSIEFGFTGQVFDVLAEIWTRWKSIFLFCFILFYIGNVFFHLQTLKCKNTIHNVKLCVLFIYTLKLTGVVFWVLFPTAKIHYAH